MNSLTRNGKKELVQSRAYTSPASRIFADSALLHLKETEHIKVRLNGLQFHMQVLQDVLGNFLQLHKESSINIGKLRIEKGGIKKDASHLVNIILKEVNSI